VRFLRLGRRATGLGSTVPFRHPSGRHHLSGDKQRETASTTFPRRRLVRNSQTVSAETRSLVPVIRGTAVQVRGDAVLVRLGRPKSVPGCDLTRSYCARSRSSVAGSAPATSSIFTRLRAPATTVTEPRLTPNAVATRASAAAVAWPSAAGSVTLTTRALSWCPPTPGRADRGRTRTVIRTAPVCAPHAAQPAVALPPSPYRCRPHAPQPRQGRAGGDDERHRPLGWTHVAGQAGPSHLRLRRT